MEKEKFDENLIIDGGTIELSEEMDILINRKIAQAEKDIDQMKMQIRWGVKQIDVVKRAASIMGIPYQTYVKHVVYRQAIEDIEKSDKVVSK
jgi:predicted DNA binding CopG/RHH family protein